MKKEFVKSQKTNQPLFVSYAAYLFFRLLALIVNALSAAATVRLAETVGALLFLRKRRREFCIQNLRQAFPGKSEEEIKKIGRGSMQSMIKVIFEFIRIPAISKKPVDFIEIRGDEKVRQALQKGKGVLLAVSHFGNWELSGIAAAAAGLPLHAIGKPHKNPFVDAYIKRLRGLTGLKTIDQRGAVQQCIRLLKQNQVIAMLIDEHAKKGGVWVDLFGQKALTSALPAMLALKYDTPVIPAFFYRETGQKSRLVFGEPFLLKRTGDYQADVSANTQEYMHYLQKEIIKRPADWTLWMHNRWRWQDSHQAA